MYQLTTFSFTIMRDSPNGTLLYCLLRLAGPHGDAGPPPLGQPAGVPPAAASSEPQLTLRGGGGARRWGPAQFQAPPAAALPRSASPGTTHGTSPTCLLLNAPTAQAVWFT